ncbi:MAG: hypothetical protein LUF26_04415 [Firmicutes bacterium]|nr:hypothetical protein [Bacillota bacterium]
MSDDWFYLGLGAASQMTNRPKSVHLDPLEDHIYLNMAGYNKERQLELEQMYREKPQEFRELLGHDKTPSPDKNNPNYFFVDGQLFPSGEAKDVAEILAREGYKYLKNINYPLISGAIKDPNYRSAVGMPSTARPTTDSYLMSPEREKEWQYTRKSVKKSLDIQLITAPQAGIIACLCVLMATASTALSNTFGWIDGSAGISLWLGFAFIYMLGAFLSWVMNPMRGKRRIGIFAGFMTYFFAVFTTPFLIDVNDIVVYLAVTIGIPLMLPLILLMGYFQNAQNERKTDPESIKKSKEAKEFFRQGINEIIDKEIQKARTEIKNNPSVLDDIPQVDAEDKRKAEWDYLKDCSKNDFNNQHRFDRYMPPCEIEMINAKKRKEETERKAEQYKQDVFRLEEEINNLYNEISNSLRGKGKSVEREELTKIYDEVKELCKGKDSLTGEAALSTAARLRLKKSQMQIFANL